MSKTQPSLSETDVIEIIEIDDDVGFQDTDVVEIEPCPTPTVKTPLKISYKAGCASVLSKLHYPDYYPDTVDFVELAIQLIRRSGYRIVRRYDRGSHIIIEFARP